MSSENTEPYIIIMIIAHVNNMFLLFGNTIYLKFVLLSPQNLDK